MDKNIRIHMSEHVIGDYNQSIDEIDIHKEMENF